MRRLFSSLILVGCVATLPAVAEPPAYTTEDGVRLTPQMQASLHEIGSEFHQRTGSRLHITSGTRTPHEQADAMYEKMARGQRMTALYRDYDAAAEIQAAYSANRRRGREPCVRAIARVIRAQLARGCFISRHLRAAAADIRSRGMSRHQRAELRQIVGSHRELSLLEEGVPPHFHLQLDDH